jgi:hypothetical protein
MDQPADGGFALAELGADFRTRKAGDQTAADRFNIRGIPWLGRRDHGGGMSPLCDVVCVPNTGHLLDTAKVVYPKPLKALALPSGIEPLSPP